MSAFWMSVLDDDCKCKATNHSDSGGWYVTIRPDCPVHGDQRTHQCDATWGTAEGLRCVRATGHGGVHFDSRGAEWGYVVLPGGEKW